MKSVVYISAMFDDFGYDTTPAFDAERGDIVQSLGLENPESLVAFCQGIQSGSPIDSYLSPNHGICRDMTARWLWRQVHLHLAHL